MSAEQNIGDMDAPISLGSRQGIGLALSGGGFRATLFHLGALWRLNELGFFNRIERISSVSGGSIVAAYLEMQWKNLVYEKGTAINFDNTVVEAVRRFCSKTIDIWAIMRILPRPWAWKCAGNALEGAFRRNLFRNANLQDFPDRPLFVILSTNLLTGASFRFMKPYASDYRYGLIRQPKFRLSEAVAASSAFPPVLSPFKLHVNPALFERIEGSDLHRKIDKSIYLTDAGVIDNLGIGPIYSSESVLISNAGATPKFEKERLPLWIMLNKRAIEIAAYQDIPIKIRSIINDFKNGTHTGTYWGINGNIKDYHAENTLPCLDEIINYIAGIRTRLNKFNETEQCLLINWGYAICDAAMKAHFLPDYMKPSAKWPYPEYALNRKISMGNVRNML